MHKDLLWSDFLKEHYELDQVLFNVHQNEVLQLSPHQEKKPIQLHVTQNSAFPILYLKLLAH